MNAPTAERSAMMYFSLVALILIPGKPIKRWKRTASQTYQSGQQFVTNQIETQGKNIILYYLSRALVVSSSYLRSVESP